jgi:hypothetical protein
METIKTKIDWIPGAFSPNPVYDALGEKLTELRWEWSKTKAPDLVRRYQAVLLTLIDLGWDKKLDVDLELPDELMPAEYFK